MAYFVGVSPSLPPDQNGTIVRATAGGLERLGPIPGGLPVIGAAALAFPARAHGWLVLGPLRQILATADGGRTWQEQYPNRPR